MLYIRQLNPARDKEEATGRGGHLGRSAPLSRQAVRGRKGKPRTADATAQKDPTGRRKLLACHVGATNERAQMSSTQYMDEEQKMETLKLNEILGLGGRQAAERAGLTSQILDSIPRSEC